MDPEKEQIKKKKSLKFSIFDGSAYSAMEGFTTNFISAFALAMKASNSFIGILATMPNLVAVFIQFLSVNIVSAWSRRKTLLIGALLQALTWLPIAFAPFYAKEHGSIFLLIFITLNAIFLAIVNPVWSSIMGDLVEEDERGKYFARRNAICSLVAFIATFIAGYTLNYFSSSVGLLETFAIMFSMAFIFRIISVFYLSKMYVPAVAPPKKKSVKFRDFIAHIRETNYGKFTMYLCFFGFAVSIASPFFTVYMLQDLKFSYLQFTIITLASIIATFVSLYLFWGKYSDRIGNKKVLLMCGLLIPFVPLLWLVFTNFYMLLIIEIFSGIVWAGFNLAASNYIYDATDTEKRTRYIVYLNFLRGISIFIGAVFGGWISNHLAGVIFTSGILFLFLISGILRMVVTLVFFNNLKEMRLIEIPVGHSFLRESVIISPRQTMYYHNSTKVYGRHKDELKKEKDNSKGPPKKEPPKLNVEEKRKVLKQYFKVSQGKDVEFEKKEERDRVLKNYGIKK